MNTLPSTAETVTTQTMRNEDMNTRGKRIRTECRVILQDVTTESGKRYTVCDMGLGKFRYKGTVMQLGETIRIHESVAPFPAIDML